VNGVTACLWFDGVAEEAANFYAATIPGSSVGKVVRAPADFPSGRKDDVLTVESTIAGRPFMGLNGGPHFTFNEAASLWPTARSGNRCSGGANSRASKEGAEKCCSR
jgi:predicted 3-demethylubiquinone-9 3-methyltransferase (glyoxalase superfamily)